MTTLRELAQEILSLYERNNELANKLYLLDLKYHKLLAEHKKLKEKKHK